MPDEITIISYVKDGYGQWKQSLGPIAGQHFRISWSNLESILKGEPIAGLLPGNGILIHPDEEICEVRPDPYGVILGIRKKSE